MFEDISQKFEKYLEIEKERNLQMLEVSRLLGVDFTFSEEEIIKNVEQKIADYMEKTLQEKFKKMVEGI
tara:strand:+ start:3010 stop:3216 length:207 start_codon:yes stop_codon:yes gene_type:complete